MCIRDSAYIEGALAIMKESKAKLADIDSIKVVVGEKSINRRLCEPLEMKQHPVVAIDAKFSIPFTVAAALVHGGLGLDSFTPQALKNTDVLNIAEKVTYEVDSKAGRVDSVQGYTEIMFKNGETKSKRIERVYGHPENPIDDASLVAKFVDCASHSVKKIDTGKVTGLIMNMEHLQDVGELMKEL
jgi:2-methylcitrate dehydratase PrpD